MEDALQRLENMTLEETRMTGTETLRAVHGVDNKVGGVEGMLQDVTDLLRGVDDRVKDIGDKVINSEQIVHLPTFTVLIVHLVSCWEKWTRYGKSG